MAGTSAESTGEVGPYTVQRTPGSDLSSALSCIDPVPVRRFRPFTRGTHHPFTGTIGISLPRSYGWCMALGSHSGRAGIGVSSKLRGSAHWRLAVWGLRLAGCGLAVAVAGLVTRVWSTGTGLSILAVGVGTYLIGAVVVFTGFIPAFRALPRPRPLFWRLRWALMRDATHARS
jgi:hypothetical protein